MPFLVDFLLKAGVKNPIVCSAINKVGFQMNPDRESYEKTLAEKPFQSMAMSIMAAGAISPKEALEYVTKLPNLNSLLFGASSRSHIIQTKKLVEEMWNEKKFNYSM